MRGGVLSDGHVHVIPSSPKRRGRDGRDDVATSTTTHKVRRTLDSRLASLASFIVENSSSSNLRPRNREPLYSMLVGLYSLSLSVALLSQVRTHSFFLSLSLIDIRESLMIAVADNRGQRSVLLAKYSGDKVFTNADTT